MRPLVLCLITLAFAALANEPATAQDRGSFTFLLSLGYGVQSGGEQEIDTGDIQQDGRGTHTGWAGLNFGIGGFVSDDVALMFRISGTAVEQEYDIGSGLSVEEETVSGVVVIDAQWWTSDRFNIELGTGLGFLGYDNDGVWGAGILAGFGYSLLLKGKFSLQVGIEDAIYIGGDRVVNNLGLCLGLQLL